MELWILARTSKLLRINLSDGFSGILSGGFPLDRSKAIQRLRHGRGVSFPRGRRMFRLVGRQPIYLKRKLVHRVLKSLPPRVAALPTETVRVVEAGAQHPTGSRIVFDMVTPGGGGGLPGARTPV